MNLLSSLLSEAVTNPVLLDIKSGIDTVKKLIVDNAKYAVEEIVIPIGIVVLVIALIAVILKIRELHKANQDYGDKITGIIIIVILIAVLSSAKLWMWSMAGV